VSRPSCYLQAILNVYAFAGCYDLLYLFPLLSPLTMHSGGFRARLNTAQCNWIVWLSCFTEVIKCSQPVAR
jgi:hypothetical protein